MEKGRARCVGKKEPQRPRVGGSAAGGAAHALGEAGRARPCGLRKKEMNGLLPGKENMQRERVGAYRVCDRIS